jgi:peptidoglycan/LPS O-acetylase OafA/YrhL
MVYSAAGLQKYIHGPLAIILTRLGDWSFGLYLSHMLTLSAVRRLFPLIADVLEFRLGLPASLADIFRIGSPGIADNIAFLVLGLIASTLVAAASFYLFEQPVLKFLNRYRNKQSDKEKARLAETTAP